MSSPKRIQTSENPNRSEAGQSSLIGLLVAVVVVGVLVAVLFFRPRERAGTNPVQDPNLPVSTKKTVPGAALDQAKMVECRNNLDQIRKAIQMENLSGEEGLPSSLQALSGIPNSMKSCPVSHRPYTYNPQTGQVFCPTPGHRF
jgi:hypothetical protein